jgi:hypothetical protein
MVGNNIRTQDITPNRVGLAGTYNECLIATGSGQGCAGPLAIAKVTCSPATVPVP